MSHELGAYPGARIRRRKTGSGVAVNHNAIYAAWYSQVLARKNRPTIMPQGPNKGKLAEAYKDRGGVWRYKLAPANVLAAQKALMPGKSTARRVAEAVTWPMPVNPVDAAKAGAAAGDRAYETVKTTATNAGREVLEMPREVAASILGIPKWAVTALTFGVGYMFLVNIGIAPKLGGR